MKTLQRIWIFLCLWRTYHYENRIGAELAWELARIFVEHDEELSQWEVLK